MKKVNILIALIIVIIGSSCKKNYNCECTRTTIISGLPDEQETLNFTVRNTKSKAQSTCSTLGYSENYVTYVQTQTCEIK